MSEITNSNVIEIGTEVKLKPLQYVYVTIPAEYICVYHRILVMLADYGIDMLKDCKATCTDRNSGVIECFNMFNSAVAAYKLSGGNENNQYGKLAKTIIKYVKSKINQIYKGKDNSQDFVFPIDENGEIKAFVSCGEYPTFYLNPDDGQLYEHKFNEAYDEHFMFGKEDISSDEDSNPSDDNSIPGVNADLDVNFEAKFEEVNGSIRPCSDITLHYNGKPVKVDNTMIDYYFDDVQVNRLNDVTSVSAGKHKFTIVVKYKGIVKTIEVERNL